MTIYPEEIYELGRRLVDKYPTLCKSGEAPEEFDECLFRTIIDRAYYSAFLTAREWLRDNRGFKPTRKGEDHDLVRRALTKSGIPNANGLAGRLSTLHKERKQASYDINGGFSKPYSKDDVTAILDSTEIFIKRVISNP